MIVRVQFSLLYVCRMYVYNIYIYMDDLVLSIKSICCKYILPISIQLSSPLRLSFALQAVSVGDFGCGLGLYAGTPGVFVLLVGWLAGWLVGWLVGWFVCLFACLLSFSKMRHVNDVLHRRGMRRPSFQEDRCLPEGVCALPCWFSFRVGAVGWVCDNVAHG